MTSQETNQIVTTVGRNIRAARDEAGLTQRRLADQLDVALVAITRWERGGILPNRRNLAKLAEVLDRDPGWFYTQHDDPVPA